MANAKTSLFALWSLTGLTVNDCCLKQLNLDRLLARMWDEMGLVRVYSKPQGQQPYFDEPFVLSSVSVFLFSPHCMITFQTCPYLIYISLLLVWFNRIEVAARLKTSVTTSTELWWRIWSMPLCWARALGTILKIVVFLSILKTKMLFRLSRKRYINKNISIGIG